MMSTELDSGMCINHDKEVAVGVCDVCNTPVCKDCLHHQDSGLVCEDPFHGTILHEWSKVYETGFEFESEMISKNLELQGIRSSVIERRDVECSDVMHDKCVVRVFVPNADYDRAIRILRELNLAEIGIDMSSHKKKE
jgi:hypothetical protein